MKPTSTPRPAFLRVPFVLLLRRAFVGCIAVVALSAQAETKDVAITLACSPKNDLFLTLTAAGLKPARHETPAQALALAPPGSAVLLLADEYPGNTVALSEELFREAAARDLRLYIEFPPYAPGVTFAAPRKTTWERFVISADDLGPALPRHRILIAHETHILPTSAANPLVVVARVAGYDTAVYGIPPTAEPVLFALEEGRVLVATTKLSGFVTGRSAPRREWAALWNHILGRLCGTEIADLKWEPLVQTMFGPQAPMPADCERETFRSAATWHYNSRLLVSEPRAAPLSELFKKGVELTEPPGPEYPSGDGRFGILEGYSATIRHDGSQPQRTPIRADCQAESAMVLALDSLVNGTRRSEQTASNLLDFLYFDSDLCGGARANPDHPSFGLIAWGGPSPAWNVANYGDDNARAMLATMLAAASLRSDRWDEALLRALVANLRTTGKFGFRGERIDQAPLERHGWLHFHDGEAMHYSPHFEAFSWACFLWAYRHTGDREFLDKTRIAMRMTMEAFPKKWRWNDNMERAHMLLCLAWLVRLEDTPEHRGWLQLMVDEFISIQHTTGALPERLPVNIGDHYQVPKSNEAYGNSETPLLQRQGDPVTDQLYVSGFALLGLHEAAAVLNDPRVTSAENKLAEYLCRIQTRSSHIPYLHGTWFRAFDFERWEPWASSGDVGWGAWSVEAGWAQAWTAGVLGLRVRKTTLWEITAETRIREKLPRVREQMSRNQGGPWQPPKSAPTPAPQSPDTRKR